MEMQHNIIDLFSGAGGFSLGAHIAGFKPILCVDIDSDLTSSFSTNFPQARLAIADLHSLEPGEILNLSGLKSGQAAGVIGGPPCQGFSFMGKRNLKDPRNQLIVRFFEYVRHIKPAFFVMENVPGLLTEPFINLLHIGLELVNPWYNILEPQQLNASWFGAATSRNRVFVIGYRPDRMDSVCEDDIRAARIDNYVTVYQALHDLPPLDSAHKKPDGEYWAKYQRNPDESSAGAYAREARRPPQNGVSSQLVCGLHSKGIISGFQPTRHTEVVKRRFANVAPGDRDSVSRCPRLSWDNQCSTLRAGTGKERGSFQSIRPIHPTEDRVISVREGARLQGFPDWFQFHTTKWHSFRMIGNSVPPPLGEHLLGVLARKFSINADKEGVQKSISPYMG